MQRGEFDVLLVKPVPSQFLVTFRYLQVLDIFGLAVGLSHHRRSACIAIGSIDAPRYPGAACAVPDRLDRHHLQPLSRALDARFLVHADRGGGEHDLAAFDRGQLSVTAYPPWARLLFTFVLPVAFVTNVPAQAATGRLSLEWGLGAWPSRLFALCGATWLWNLAIRNYSSASS